MGAVVAGDGEVGGRCTDAGTVLYCGGIGGTSVWVRDVGCVSEHWEDAGTLPPQGGLQVDGEVAKEEDRSDVGLPPTDGVDGRGGHTGGGDVDTYVALRQNKSAQYIATRPIMDLCLEAEQ